MSESTDRYIKILKKYWGYDSFRGIQREIVESIGSGKDTLGLMPTGGGKSITFQVPALAMEGVCIVVTPLISLMKDQVDNLADRGIADAVTINGLLDPISRSLAIQRVQNGEASLLYIAPEMLRSKTIERILTARHIERFVIDEAHCFSSWGQDFRVDYLYIGKFIRNYQKSKQCKYPIPVS